MPAYNKNSVFAVSNSGVIPNTVDDLVFFEDIGEGQKYIWDEFEQIMASGDYDAANSYIMSYAEVHGYFGDLYNLMVNRIKAVQDLLILNRTNINNGTGVFSSFIKPEIFKYQTTPNGIVKDQVWIGRKDYFAEASVKESVNKLEITWPDGDSYFGLDFAVDQMGYITINGTCTRSTGNVRDIKLGETRTGVVSNSSVWSWWNYYVSGSIKSFSNGRFKFAYRGADGEEKRVEFNSSRTANMHANLIGLGSNTIVQLLFEPIYLEKYEDLKVGFMVCKTAETTPNQKYVKFGA